MTTPKPFRFELARLEVDGFAGTVRKWWQSLIVSGTAGFFLSQKLKLLKGKLNAWKEFLSKGSVMADSIISELNEIDIKEEKVVLSVEDRILGKVKHISSSKTYLLLSNQIQKSKAEVDRCHALLEKPQVEKDDFVWWEKEVNMKVDLADISQRIAAIVGSRIIEIEKELKRQISETNLLESRLEEASREPGWKKIIAEFKGLLSSLPKDMDVMQSRLSEYKEGIGSSFSTS